MGATRLLVVAVALLTVSTPAGAAVPPLAEYFNKREMRLLHPRAPGDTYHNELHSEDTRVMAYDLAIARGLSPRQARFISEVALLHDIDPLRAPGTPARVEATLKLLEADFAGRRPLLPGYPGRSVLRERFGWTPRDFRRARVMIYRTKHPFRGRAMTVYRRMLEQLPVRERAFVMREAALLSEYADKASTYAMRAYPKVTRATIGLAREFNRAAGRRVTTVRKLDPSTFLHMIGTKESFARDHVIADRLGVRLVIPLRAQVFRKLLPHYGRRFNQNERLALQNVRNRALGRLPTSQTHAGR